VKELAPGVSILKGDPLLPRWTINAYLVGDVLVDAARRWDAKRIVKQLEPSPPAAHALTHAHADHQGASKAVCERFGIPYWVPERDADAAEDPTLMKQRQPRHPINSLYYRLWAGPGHPVDRRLSEGDEVGGFTVLDTPGHSAGHVAFWRESDRVLILGDVLNNIDTMTMMRGLRQPKDFFTPDPATNRRSIRRLGELEPKLVLFGHGPPLSDTRKFVDFCNAVPAG
jgi:glyoxylase-like metal-dependent hydrolase (beta-lactamase superfamily II)